MTRQDTVIQWIAYGAALLIVAAADYYVLGPMPMSLPLLLPAAAAAGGVLEGPAFGAVYGALAGLMMSGLGHEGAVCVLACAAVGWLAGLIAQYVLRRDWWGYLICAAGTLALWEVWQVGSRYLAGLAPLEALLSVALPELGWSLVFLLPVYWLERFCCVRFGRIAHE